MKKIASVTPITAAPSATAKEIVSVKSDIEAAIPRDQWKRPRILQPDGTLVSYRRASSVVEALEDHFGLHEWEKGLVAQGLAQRPDLVMSLHGADKAERRDIIETAMEQAGYGVASRNGTTMHGLTERLDLGEELPPNLPSNIVAMLEAYEKKTRRFRVVDSERFVVQDKIKVAGTYDRKVYDEVTGDEYIGDLKTGQNPKYLAVKAPAQVAVYASGDYYDLDGEREAHGANRDRGLLIHLPWVEDPKDAECELYWLDLRIGRKAILHAMKIDTIRKITMGQSMPRVKEV